MKLIDKAFDKMIETSKPILVLAESVRTLALRLNDVAKSILVLAQNQAAHQQLIQQMWTVQQAIYTKLQESSLDTQMPGGKRKVDPKGAKSN